MLNIKKIGQGEPLVFIHGFGFNHKCFDEMINELKAKYLCLAIDLPGFGESLYEPYELETLTEKIFSQLPYKKVHMLGWSLGGAVALAYAKKYSSQVMSLISIASNPLFIAKNEWPGMPKQAFEFFAKQCRRDYKKAQANFSELQQVSKSSANQYNNTYKIPFDNNCSQQAISNALYMLEQSDLRDDIQKLEVPCLSIFGKHDQLVPFAIIKSLKQLNPQNKICLFEQSAHVPFLTEKKLFINTLDNFICNR